MDHGLSSEWFIVTRTCSEGWPEAMRNIDRCEARSRPTAKSTQAQWLPYGLFSWLDRAKTVQPPVGVITPQHQSKVISKIGRSLNPFCFYLGESDENEKQWRRPAPIIVRIVLAQSLLNEDLLDCFLDHFPGDSLPARRHRRQWGDNDDGRRRSEESKLTGAVPVRRVLLHPTMMIVVCGRVWVVLFPPK